MRLASSAHGTLASAPASIPTKKVPNPRAATSASAMLVRSGTRPAVCGSSSSREASTTPTTAGTTPPTWSAAGPAPPGPAATPGPAGPGRPSRAPRRWRLVELAGGEHRADDGGDDARDLDGGGRVAAGDADDHGHGGTGGRDRRDDAHRADRERAVERTQRDGAGETRGGRGPQVDQRRRIRPRDRHPDGDGDQAGRLADEQHGEHAHAPALEAAEEVAEPPEERRRQTEGDREHERIVAGR